MHISLPGRIGIYLILSGVVLDLVLRHFGDFHDDFGFTVLLFPVAMLMLLAWAIGQFNERTNLLARKRAEALAISQCAGLIIHRPRHLILKGPIYAMPSFGLLFATTLLLISWYIFFLDQIFGLSPRGFWVSIPRQSPAATAQVPLEGKIIFRLDARNRWYLNSKEISPAELPGALQKALAQRPDWIVYFEASREIDYKDAVSAMNAIRNAHAQIVLITSPMKASTP